MSEELNVGVPTLTDILEELRKPGRDPRDEMPKVVFRSDVMNFEDMKVGMKLTGTVRNVVDFGAFVDIGVKQDGLVHLSEMSDKYIKNPYGSCTGRRHCQCNNFKHRQRKTKNRSQYEKSRRI